MKFIKCDVNDSSVLKYKSKYLKRGTEYSYDHSKRIVQVRREFDRWADIDVRDLEDFGYMPMQKAPPREPITFEARAVPFKRKELENHGVTEIITQSYCIEIPQGMDVNQFETLLVEIKYKNDY